LTDAHKYDEWAAAQKTDLASSREVEYAAPAAIFGAKEEIKFSELKRFLCKSVLISCSKNFLV